VGNGRGRPGWRPGQMWGASKGAAPGPDAAACACGGRVRRAWSAACKKILDLVESPSGASRDTSA
jgi:hypothetical protein